MLWPLAAHPGLEVANHEGRDDRPGGRPEEFGIDGADVRVHHFVPLQGSPFPLLAAIGARTKRIEIGTAVIDMRYENPLYIAEDAAATDLTRR